MEASGSDHTSVQHGKGKEMEATRQSAGFCSSLWGDYFITHQPAHAMHEKPKNQLQRMGELKEEVKRMLKDANDLLVRIELIDVLCRLGIEYHFKDEIHEVLQEVYNVHVYDADLHFVALRFQLLRSQGYNESAVNADALKKFLDREEKFKENKSLDARDLLSLYEAACLGTREEDILDEAMNFAKDRLKSMIKLMEPTMAKQVKRALETPFHRGIERLEARNYISIYQEDKDHNPMLLELAKLDFNWLQSFYQVEIRNLSLWWKDLGLAQKLHFSRDRIVECYFWILGVTFVPHCSKGRMFLTKLLVLQSVMDDIFDVYGTIEELEQFTDVIQRWDLQNVNELPDYMKVFLHSFLGTIKEIEEWLPMERRHYLCYFSEAMKALVRAYLQEAKWASKGYIPTLEEYLQITVITSTYPMLICVSYILMEENVTKDVLDWVIKVPMVVKASSLICRLINDVVSTKFEQQRKHVASSVQCCMKDDSISEQEACKKLYEMIANCWKDINKEYLNQNPSRRPILMLTLNFTRVLEFMYKNKDGYTDPTGDTEDQIALLLVHPIELSKEY